MKKVVAMNQQKEKKVIKTWSRDSSVFPEMVGHLLGEFAPTRRFRAHGHHTEKSTTLK